MKDVILWTGAGQIEMAIARTIGYGKKIVVGDKNIENDNTIAKIMSDAGFDLEAIERILHVDLYGTAVLLEKVGKVIKKGGTGVTISSQSGHRMEQL